MPRTKNYRVILIGSPAVGKTTIIAHLSKSVNNDQLPMSQNQFFTYEPTITPLYSQHKMSIPETNNKILLNIWDTAGQEKYKSISELYFQDADAAIFVYDITKRHTFESLEDWLAKFRDVAPEKAIIYVSANKCDIIEIESDEFDIGRDWATSHGFKFFKTSAITGLNVVNMFQALAEELQICNVSEAEIVKLSGKDVDLKSGCGC